MPCFLIYIGPNDSQERALGTTKIRYNGRVTYIHTYIHTYIVNLSELLCLIPILVGSSVATVCPPERDTAFKDGSYDRYQSTTVVALYPWPAVIAPKFLRPLVRPGSSPLASLRFPPAHVLTPEGWKAELALTDLTPQSFD